MDIFNNNELFLLGELIKRNFTARYKDSVLGVFWCVLKPLLMMILLTIVFSTIFKGHIENYPAYLLSGRCIFYFFADAVSASMSAIRLNKNILQKTAAPKHIFIISNVFSEFINFLISVILLIGIMIITNTPFYFLIMPISIIPIIATTFMCMGVGLMLAILNVHYSDISHLWSVILMFLMYASAIFYPMDIIPKPFYNYAILNPIYWAIEQFRNTIYQGIIPSTLGMINLLLISIIIFIVGLIIYKKYEKKVLMKL